MVILVFSFSFSSSPSLCQLPPLFCPITFSFTTKSKKRKKKVPAIDSSCLSVSVQSVSQSEFSKERAHISDHTVAIARAGQTRSHFNVFTSCTQSSEWAVAGRRWRQLPTTITDCCPFLFYVNTGKLVGNWPPPLTTAADHNALIEVGYF